MFAPALAVGLATPIPVLAAGQSQPVSTFSTSSVRRLVSDGSSAQGRIYIYNRIWVEGPGVDGFRTLDRRAATKINYTHRF